jgi:hypothetical protein
MDDEEEEDEEEDKPTKADTLQPELPTAVFDMSQGAICLSMGFDDWPWGPPNA